METTATPSSSSQQRINTFSAADYSVFGVLFLISGLIGIFFAIKDKNKKNAENYLLAGRSMSGWPVALSLTASFMSAITVLGTPAEVYVYGTMFWWFFVSYTVTVIVTANVFVPVFYKMNISSTYEYLEARFNRTVRVACTVTFIFQTVLYMGMVVYMPALALNKVTGLSLIVSIVATSLVCIFYTSIGGMKAVVWNDVVQCVVMWIGFVAIIIKGSIDVGGFDKVFEIAYDGGRIDFFQFDFDPRVRHTIWSICIGGSFTWLSVYAINQSMVQRYLSCSSLWQAKLSLYLNDLGLLVVLSLACLTGLVMFAIYATCDPLTAGRVEKSDQLIPYLVMDILSVAPGIPGLFVASAYSGTLSTVSTGINALACSTYEDLIKPIYPNMSGSKAVLVSKLLVVVYGILSLGVAFLASFMDKILTIALKMFGIIGGPMLGVFCMGLFTPVANSAGALVGLFGGLSVGIWLGIGSMVYPPLDEFTRKLPQSMEGCDAFNITFNSTENLNMNKTLPNSSEMSLATSFYSLSYCYYSIFLVGVTWLLGIIVSLITGGLNTKKYVDRKLLTCPGDNVCCCVGRRGCSCRDSAYVQGKESDKFNADSNSY